MASTESSLLLLNPSSDTYPRQTNAAPSAVVASVGNVVPRGAVYIAPLIFGLPVVTLVAVLPIFMSPLYNNRN